MAETLLKNASVFTGDDIAKLDVKINGNIISEVGENLFGGELIDCTGKIILPGVIDIHTHGVSGYDFSSANVDGIKNMTDFYAENGVTSVLATTMTMPHNEYKTAMTTIRDYMRDPTGKSRVLGIYMEGPFLGEDKKGAHDKAFLENPDLDYYSELNKLSGDNIKVVAVDPLLDNADEFISAVSKSKVISLAHSSANYDKALKAFENGVTGVTHIFNAMNGLLHREPGIIGAFLDNCYNNDIRAEMICDGIHIHPSVMRMMYNIAAENMIIISDSMSATGLSDGTYSLGGIEVFVKDRKATQRDGTIAGSTATAYECMRNLIDNGVNRVDAIRSATYTPALHIGMEDKLGSIKAGYLADLIVAYNDFEIKNVYIDGINITA